MEFTKMVVLVSLTILIAGIFLKILVGKLLFNHKPLSLFAKSFYNYFYSIEKANHLRANNFGYAPVDDEIKKYDSDLQYGLQLYKESVKNNKGFLIDENCTLVEIGCGIGGGSEFLINKFKPKKYMGIDYSKIAIAFCNHTYSHLENVNFICADAHRLPLENDTADVIINVESSHIYKDMNKFLQEVYRVLKYEGKFLYTDFRYIKHIPIDALEFEINKCGFSIIEKRIVTPHIFNACELASERRAQIINKASPWYLKKFFQHYAILKGTKKFKKLSNGDIIYFIYHLEKHRTMQ